MYPALLVVAIISTIIAIIAVNKRSITGVKSLLVFTISLTVWAAILLIVWNSPLSLIGLSFASLCANIVATATLTCILEYTNRKHWLNGRNLAILSGLPVISQVLLWLDPWYRLSPTGTPKIAEIITFNNPWFWTSIVNINSLLLIASLLLSHTFIRIPKLNRSRPSLTLFGVLAPLLIGIVNLSGGIHFFYFVFLPIVFVLTGMILSLNLLHNDLLGTPTITRDMVIETINDGWMVLDAKNRIIDLNPAAEELIGTSRERIYGKPAEEVLSNWPNLRTDQDRREKEIKGSVNLKGEWRYLNIRISPLIGREGTQVGQIIVWRDITERRKGDDARQRARDEMFTLLHAISGTASRALNLDDFLSETIYQIVYSFQSQSCAIYLLEENSSNEAGISRLSLAAHQGLPAKSISNMLSVPETNEMLSWVLKYREPLLIPDISKDPRVPASMQQLGPTSILIVPMSIEGQIIGTISLARNEGPIYSTDEISRLTVVADEVAIFIHSNSQRQSAIAMAERQRLARDLHDSVTQKLYGLLTLTEAAQAGLEAGSTDMPAQVLSRIGDHARQALKEMRLFLFELQPVDLEREGLVAILHQRLAAVEGRADIKARLLADENISLPLHQEETLYYIAQEALNNVLKHAGADTVTVRLKKRKINVLLEIEDDGCGFDPQEADQAGMGLRNIKERVSQVGGKLNILSAPGKGTKISVTINRTRIPKTASR